jgi:hypothetical protein
MHDVQPGPARALFLYTAPLAVAVTATTSIAVEEENIATLGRTGRRVAPVTHDVVWLPDGNGPRRTGVVVVKKPSVVGIVTETWLDKGARLGTEPPG